MSTTVWKAGDAPAIPRPDPALLYRLPWTAADNAMTWLEPTRRCNMVCDACFVQNDPASDKSLDQIRLELETMLAMRRCDAMLVAGGEPLVHAHIEEIVRLVRAAGVKPVIVTNGMALDRRLLRALKRAGAFGFTFHVDSHQQRPGWTGCNESELNPLRTELAEMVHAEGGLTCAFNVTVFPDALPHVKEIVAWAVGIPDKVHILTLICVRTADPEGPFRFYCGGRPVDLRATPYAGGEGLPHLMTEDLYAEIREVLPGFDFCAYLGGTVRPQSLKWVIGCHVASKRASYGNLGAKTMELLQNGSHAFTGRFLAHASPRLARQGAATLTLALVDRKLRACLRRYVRAVVRRPAELFARLSVQSISVVQPVDILPNGEMDTCDGCPNRTYWEGRLVAACRLEEYKTFGGPLQAGPRDAGEV